MEILVSKLCEILKKEIAIYTQILSISTKKTDIIIKGKISTLDEMVKEEHELIGILGKIEISREQVFVDISEKLKLDINNTTLSDIIKLLPNEHAKNLEVLQNNLLSQLAELKTLNDTNGKLIENSLEFIDFSINVLSNAANPGNNYNTGGYTESAGSKRLFDMKL